MSTNSKGISIYLALMVMVILLALALGLAAILFSQMRMIREIGYSVIAFYAADTGIEREAFEGNKPGTKYSGYLDLNKNGIKDGEDSFYHIFVLSPGKEDCPEEINFCIKSIGSYKGVKRAILVFR